MIIIRKAAKIAAPDHEDERSFWEWAGAFIAAVGLALLARSAVARGWLSPTEAIGLYALITGLWLSIRNRKGG